MIEGGVNREGAKYKRGLTGAFYCNHLSNETKTIKTFSFVANALLAFPLLCPTHPQLF